MKKAFPIALVVLGFVLLGAGAYTVNRGVNASHQVRDELVAQRVTTPADAAIPNVKVTNAKSAKAMADVIGKHVDEATKGKTYAELGRYLSKTGGDTSDPNAALIGANGKPVPNPVRDTAFQGDTLRTSLYTSVMAFNVATLVEGLGVMMGAIGIAIGGVGVALAGLAIPKVARKFHIYPAAADSQAY